MTSTPISLSYGVTDCKISVLTADPAGGEPTYAAPIDFPGVTKLTVDIATSQAVLRGDNTQLDVRATITGVSGKLEGAKMSLDVLAALLAGTVATAGATPNEVKSWDLTSSSSPQPVKIECITDAADPVGGNLSFTLHKAMATKVSGLGAEDQKYTTPSLDVSCSPLLSNGKWFTPAVNETAAVLDES